MINRRVLYDCFLFKGVMMKNSNWSTLTAVIAFLIGVILLWSFGREWLNFSSPLVFLAGLIGVAIPVLVFAAWKIHQRSNKDHK